MEDKELESFEDMDFDVGKDTSAQLMSAYEYLSARGGVPEIRQETVYDQINRWINNVKYKEYEASIGSMVVGQAELKVLLVNVYLYLKDLVFHGKANRHSVILAGPSGCGKTETYRALKEYFRKEIPLLVISIVDMNQITPEGFNGKNTNFIINDLKLKSDGAGIIFLDEFDKRLVPSHTSHGDNVNENIQAQLLMAVEGCKLDGIDTSKTMFIGMGSFDAVRAGRKEEKKIGFVTGQERPDKLASHYFGISIEDMTALGGLHELIGRFVTVINYGQLSPEAIDRIIDLRLSEISEEIGYIILLDDKMRAFLHANANTKFGNRRIYSLLRDTVNSAMIEILENNIRASLIMLTGAGTYQIYQDDAGLAG